MLFVALMKIRGGTEEERVSRRMQWEYPEGMRLVAEYWLQTSDPNVITVSECDHIAPFMQAIAAWNDVYDIRVFPAVTGEEGMELVKQMMG